MPRASRGAITAYAIEGRISVRRADSAYHANLYWRHRPESDELHLTGPFGQGLADLVRDAAGARLTTAERREYKASDWNALAAQVFGIALPLDDVARWVTGYVADAQLDSYGRPVQAEVSGWRIHFLTYESDDRNALPTALDIERGDIQARLKIDQWQID